MDLQLACWNRGAADAVETVAPSDEIAFHLMAGPAVLIMDLRSGFVVLNTQRLRCKMDRRAVSDSRRDQVLHDFLLRVNGDGLADQVCEIDAMASAIEPQLHSLVLQALAFQALAHSTAAQQLDCALFENAGTHPRLDIFT